MGLESEAYSGMATVGKIRSYFMAVLAVLIMLVMCYLGYWWMDTNNVRVAGTITTINSSHTAVSTTSNGTSTTFIASVVVKYDYKGTRTATMQLSGSRPFGVGQTVELSINPGNPTTPSEASPWWIGPAFIGVGLLVGVSGCVNAYMTSESKAYAAVEGTAASVGMVRDVL